ncbi:Zip-domain-containing protein [Meira miltonrushii]|uniref:Zip-domain-containing protein n=1 Tax=Meira miltonrushii TaxID=1280837 RepID=A0A316VFQ9_9BASI|nr:Zip-domain-containing protein [Meira miltonrushii]PWN36154.1 Zip-domain-containing protein [Meira miltonrushii]
MVTSPLVVLALQCAGMLTGTFICGIIPLYLSLSKTKLRMLEVIGAGLLVGASMTVVLPEGVQALYSAGEGHHSHEHGIMAQSTSHLSQIPSTLASGQAQSSWAWSKLSKRTTRERDFDPENTVGIALLAGFLVMFLIDQIASPGAHVHAGPSGPDREAHSHWHGPSHRPEALRLTRASSLMISKDDPSQSLNSSSGRHFRVDPSSTESSPEQMPADHDYVPHSQAHLLDDSHHTGTSTTSRDDSRPANRPRKSSDAQNRGTSANGGHSDSSHSRSIRQAFASIAGLIIHAAADGIAMGASAGSDDDSLKLVVLLAIMIHKAPAAFGLCTLLMGQRLHKSQIRKAIAIFSLSTPVGAIFTYLFLSLVLKSSPDSNSNGIGSEHIGGALTFSAGTFMFVAMHAVQELTSAAADIDLDASTHHHHHGHAHHYEGVSTSPHGAPAEALPRQILGRTGRLSCFLLGTILPKILQGLVGHHH